MASMHLCIAASHAPAPLSSKLEEPELADLTASANESDSTCEEIAASPRLAALLSSSGEVELTAPGELAPHPVRATRAGQHALRCYATHRVQPAETADEDSKDR